MDLIERGATLCRHPWETARAEAVERILRAHAPANASILDIGCGDGFMLWHIAQKGLGKDLHGVDINLTPAEMATLSRGPVTCQASLNEVKRPFDIILMMDVLEHVDNDVQFLKDIIRDHTHPGTLFLITVPAYQALSCSHDAFLKHHRRYNRSGLLRILHEAGLDTTAEGSLFASLLLPRICQCLTEKIFRRVAHPQGIGTWNHGPFLTMIIKILYNIDNTKLWYLNKCDIHFPGLSLWATARRQP